MSAEMRTLQYTQPNRAGRMKPEISPPAGMLPARSMNRLCRCLFQKNRSSACMHLSARQVPTPIRHPYPLEHWPLVIDGILRLHPACNVIASVGIVEWAGVQMALDQTQQESLVRSVQACMLVNRICCGRGVYREDLEIAS